MCLSHLNYFLFALSSKNIIDIFTTHLSHGMDGSLASQKTVAKDIAELKTQLFELIKINAPIEKIQRIVDQKGLNIRKIIKAPDAFGKTPLHRAAENGRADVCMLLIDRGAGVNDQSDGGITFLCRGPTALHLAAMNGHAHVCSLLIEKDADVNALDEFDCTPLTLAAKIGHAETSRLLIEKGGTENTIEAFKENKDPIGRLKAAASFGRVDICKSVIRSVLYQSIFENRHPAVCRAQLRTALLCFMRMAQLPLELIHKTFLSTPLEREFLCVLYNDHLLGRVALKRDEIDRVLTLARQNLVSIKNAMGSALVLARTDDLASLLDPQTLEQRLEELLFPKGSANC